MQIRNLIKCLDLTTLQLLLSIHQEGTLSGGARREAIAVSAASKRLQELERAIGVQLFVRENKGMKLTHAGETVRRHAQQMLCNAQSIGLELRGESMRVRVAANPSAIAQFLPEDFQGFLHAHSSIGIDLLELSSSDVLLSVQGGTADLGICAPMSEKMGELLVDTRPYWRDRIVLVTRADHPLAQHGRRTSLADTLDADYVDLQGGDWISVQAQRVAAEYGKTLKVRAHVRGFDALCRTVLARVGVGLLPHGAFRAIGEPLGLVAIELDDAWTDRQLQIVVSAERPQSRAVSALFDYLSQVARNACAASSAADYDSRFPLAAVAEQRIAFEGAWA
ncbi:LysR substrate-binding domain-containing protein [Trinickia dinghuensis]|uniref:LysR family transcriptional regulator n=1 Tax=Trinickia dinghuensis TaxID=2291023 RepID=A0A3D8K5C9_9BURK|nr:LysR substrate-binding domain-containing protein [Trinickia dinghuensis]RDV00644.1 LysR family transcriptional regulator [Trinickia dinghuensis]